MVIGYAHWVNHEKGFEAEVRTLGVVPEFRGRGIGQKLLSACLAQAFELGCRSCRLTVATTNASALNIYRRAKFEVTEKTSSFRKDFLPL